MQFFKKNKKNTIILPASNSAVLNHKLKILVEGCCSNEVPFEADAFIGNDQIAVSCSNLNTETKGLFKVGNIKGNSIFQEDGSSDSIKVEDVRQGLNMAQVLMLGQTRWNNTSDETLRREVLILFQKEEPLRQTILRLIRAGCDNQTSWMKWRINQKDQYLLKVQNIPLFELLTLQDEYDVKPESEKNGEGCRIFRRLFIKKDEIPSQDDRPSNFFVPWGYYYPALEDLLGRISGENTDLLVEKNKVTEIPREGFIRIYDPQSKLNVSIPTRETPVVKKIDWPPLPIPIKLRRKRIKDGKKRAVIWLVDISPDNKGKRLKQIQEQIYATPEGGIRQLDAAVLEAEEKIFLAVKSTQDPVRYGGNFLGLEGKAFEEWRFEKDKRLTLFLPVGYELFPSLFYGTYLDALGISGFSSEDVLLHQKEAGLEEQENELTLLHLPSNHFQSLRDTLVEYSAKINRSEISRIMESATLDFVPFEVSMDQGDRKDEIPGEDREERPMMGESSPPTEVAATPVSGDLSQENENGFRPEMEHLIAKARAGRLKKEKEPFHTLLDEEEWQKLLTLTYACSPEKLQSLPPVLFAFLFAGDLDLKNLFADFKEGEAILGKLRVIFSAALSILPEQDAQALGSLLERILGKNNIQIDGSQLTIHSLEETKKRSKQVSPGYDELANLLERAILLSIIPESQRESQQVLLDALINEKTAIYKKLLVILHQLYESQWERLIHHILNNYESIGMDAWEKLFEMNLGMEKSARFLSTPGEAALAAKIMFATDVSNFPSALETYIGFKPFENMEKLVSFVSKKEVPLAKRILLLYKAFSSGEFLADDNLCAKITRLDEEVAPLEDLRLQWLYAMAVFKANRDAPLRVRVRDRIKRFIREHRVDGLLFPFIREAILRQTREAQHELMGQVVDIFEENNRLIYMWIQLLDAWKRVRQEPLTLGRAPTCGNEPHCSKASDERELNTECPPDRVGRDGFFCAMKRLLHGYEGGTKEPWPVDTFKNFLAVIEEETTSVDEENEPHSLQENEKTLKLKAFLEKLDKTDQVFQEENGSELPSKDRDWILFHSNPKKVFEIMLSDSPSLDDLMEKANLPSGANSEIINYFKKIEGSPLLKRLGDLLSNMTEWQRGGLEEAVEFLVEKVGQRSPALLSRIGAGELKFIINHTSALISLGRIEEAISQAEIFFVSDLSLPFASQYRTATKLLERLSRMTSMEKLRYRERLKGMLQDSSFFRGRGMDFKNFDESKLELLESITSLFQSTSHEEEKAQERIINIERRNLLRQMERDCQ